jgi:hypothetical protein
MWGSSSHTKVPIVVLEFDSREGLVKGSLVRLAVQVSREHHSFLNSTV